MSDEPISSDIPDDEQLCSLEHYLTNPGGASARDLRITRARLVRADNLLTEAVVALDGGNSVAARTRVCAASKMLRTVSGIKTGSGTRR